MANLVMEIEAQIVGAKTSAAKQNVGVIREIETASPESKVSKRRNAERDDRSGPWRHWPCA